MAYQSQVQLLHKWINSADLWMNVFEGFFSVLKHPPTKQWLPLKNNSIKKIVSESIEVWWGTWLFIVHRRMSTQPSRCANDCFCVRLRQVPAGTCPVCPSTMYAVRTHAVVQPHTIFNSQTIISSDFFDSNFCSFLLFFPSFTLFEKAD